MTPETEIKVKLSAREFILPLVRDIVILGKQAPIGPMAMGKAMEYLHAHKFVMVECSDEVIEAIFIRENILLKVAQDRLVAYLIHKIKSLMSPTEILHIEMDLEIIMEDNI